MLVHRLRKFLVHLSIIGNQDTHSINEIKMVQVKSNFFNSKKSQMIKKPEH